MGNVVRRQFDETVAKDAVIATDPAGKAPPDSTVALVVSDGPAPIVVPNVARKSYDAAAAQLQTMRLGAARVEQFSNTVPAGQVIRTEPAVNTKAPRDSVVQVFVSKGPDMVAVPDLHRQDDRRRDRGGPGERAARGRQRGVHAGQEGAGPGPAGRRPGSPGAPPSPSSSDL